MSVCFSGQFVDVHGRFLSKGLHRSQLGAEVSPHRSSTFQPNEGAATERTPLGASEDVPRERARRVRPRHVAALLCHKRRRQRCEATVQGAAPRAVGVVRVPHDQLRSGPDEFAYGGFLSCSVSVLHAFYTGIGFSGYRFCVRRKWLQCNATCD